VRDPVGEEGRDGRGGERKLRWGEFCERVLVKKKKNHGDRTAK